MAETTTEEILTAEQLAAIASDPDVTLVGDTITMPCGAEVLDTITHRDACAECPPLRVPIALFREYGSHYGVAGQASLAEKQRHLVHPHSYYA